MTETMTDLQDRLKSTRAEISRINRRAHLGAVGIAACTIPVAITGVLEAMPPVAVEIAIAAMFVAVAAGIIFAVAVGGRRDRDVAAAEPAPTDDPVKFVVAAIRDTTALVDRKRRIARYGYRTAAVAAALAVVATIVAAVPVL